jgi:hypothetical protein
MAIHHREVGELSDRKQAGIIVELEVRAALSAAFCRTVLAGAPGWRSGSC